jgi:hypothetical protein
MDLHLRQLLDELLERLHVTHDEDDVRAQELQGQVRKALDEDDHQGLVDRFTEDAVEFESDHPDLADFLRRLADTFGAAGI